MNVSAVQLNSSHGLNKSSNSTQKLSQANATMALAQANSSKNMTQ
jgi:hypothetical protein